jgi:aspartate ammonia-lyase
MTTRIEHDLHGDERLSDQTWYGIQTLRALRHFNITGVPIHHFPDLINTLATVKEAVAFTRFESGHLSEQKFKAISQACLRIRLGELHDQFVVDLIQGNAAEATNTNANEVIANLGLSILGQQKGQYQFLHPSSDINQGCTGTALYRIASRLSVALSLQALQHALGSMSRRLAQKTGNAASVIPLHRPKTSALNELLNNVHTRLSAELATSTAVFEQLCTLHIDEEHLSLQTGVGYCQSPSHTFVAHLARISELAVTHTDSPDYNPNAAFLELSSIQSRTAMLLSEMSATLEPYLQQSDSALTASAATDAIHQTALQIAGSEASIKMASQSPAHLSRQTEPVMVYNLLNATKMLTAAIYMLDHRCMRTLDNTAPSISDLRIAGLDPLIQSQAPILHDSVLDNAFAHRAHTHQNQPMEKAL